MKKASIKTASASRGTQTFLLMLGLALSLVLVSVSAQAVDKVGGYTCLEKSAYLFGIKDGIGGDDYETIDAWRKDGTVSTNLRNRAIRYCTNTRLNVVTGIRFGILDDNNQKYYRLHDYGSLSTSRDVECETIVLEDTTYVTSLQIQYSSQGVNRLVFSLSNGEYRISGGIKSGTRD